MSDLRRHPRRDDRGFVLVGVIMFVLALTILGLSLYGLSSFEVGFIQDSIDRQQAFYDASGGLERAKWILAQKGTLQSATMGIPDGNGVVYVRAWRPDVGIQDSVGQIHWSSNEKIAIRVKAVRGANQKSASMVQCAYTTDQVKNLYQNLISSAGQVAASTQSPTIIFSGDVAQNSGNTTWQSQVTLNLGSVSIGGVPSPDVVNFMSRMPVAPTATYEHRTGGGPNPGRSYYHLDYGGLTLPTGEILFRGVSTEQDPYKPLNSKYEVETTEFHTFIPIRGTVIWLIAGGAHFTGTVIVQGGLTDRLIIIAGTSLDSGPQVGMKNIGIWTDSFTSLQSPTILVSDGTISFSRVTTGDVTTTWLCAFAADFHTYVTTGATVWALTHTALFDSAVIDPLIDHELLPNVTPGQNRRLDRVAGTWSLVTKSDPDN